MAYPLTPVYRGKNNNNPQQHNSHSNNRALLKWFDASMKECLDDGGDMERARGILRDAFSHGVHPHIIFHALIGMESNHGGSAAARARLEDWRRFAGACGEYWCHYILFEVQHGSTARASARRARAVAEDALLACPRDPAVYAMYAKAELLLRRPARARAVVRRACDAFAAAAADDDDDDGGAVKWLTCEMETYGKALRAARPPPNRSLFVRRFFCCGGGDRSWNY